MREAFSKGSASHSFYEDCIFARLVVYREVFKTLSVDSLSL